MKKLTKLIIHIVVLVAILLGILLLIQDASHVFRAPGYDAGAPTQTKFASLSRWIPAEADFIVAVDVPKALSNPLLRERLTAIVKDKSGVAAELISALMQNEDAVGLLCIAGILGEIGSESNIVVLAQGGFDGETIMPAIRTAMSEGRAGLAAQNLGWSTLYTESDSRDPFGFMLLDDTHLAVGDRDSLVAFFEVKPEPADLDLGEAGDVLFGYLAIGHRLKNSAPKAMYLPDAAYLSSADGVSLTVTIPCDDAAKAQSVRMLLEGMMSLMTLQEKPKGEEGVAGIIKGVTMEAAGTDVIVKAKLLPLLDLWLGQPEAPEPDLTPRQGQTRSQGQPAPEAR